MSPDLRQATCWVRPFQVGESEGLVAALERHHRFIRGLLAPRLKLKFMPDIHFRLDTSLDYASRMDRLFENPVVKRDIDWPGRGAVTMARDRRGRPVNGWLVLDKPLGMTSTAAVAGSSGCSRPPRPVMPARSIRSRPACCRSRSARRRRLWPMSWTGEKTYRFTVRWGAETTTDDAEGDVVETSERRPARGHDRSRSAAVHRHYRAGSAAFSAIKVEGERAYDLARAAKRSTSRPGRCEIYEPRPVEAGCRHGRHSRSTAARAPMCAPWPATWRGRSGAFGHVVAPAPHPCRAVSAKRTRFRWKSLRTCVIMTPAASIEHVLRRRDRAGRHPGAGRRPKRQPPRA